MRNIGDRKHPEAGGLQGMRMHPRVNGMN